MIIPAFGIFSAVQTACTNGSGDLYQRADGDRTGGIYGTYGSYGTNP